MYDRKKVKEYKKYNNTKEIDSGAFLLGGIAGGILGIILAFGYIIYMEMTGNIISEFVPYLLIALFVASFIVFMIGAIGVEVEKKRDEKDICII